MHGTVPAYRGRHGAPVITAHLTREAVAARMFLYTFRMMIRNVNLSLDTWQLDKGHRYLLV